MPFWPLPAHCCEPTRDLVPYGGSPRAAPAPGPCRCPLPPLRGAGRAGGAVGDTAAPSLSPGSLPPERGPQQRVRAAAPTPPLCLRASSSGTAQG